MATRVQSNKKNGPYPAARIVTEMVFDVKRCETVLKVKNESEEQPPRLSTKCMVCHDVFPNLPECLKHELLCHSLQNSSSATKPINIRLNVANKFLNSTEKKTERIKVHNALQTCEKGKELETVLRLLCLDNDCLDLIFTRIKSCLATDLSSLGKFEIFAVGSSASGLALRDADIDIYIDTSHIRFNNFRKSPNNLEMSMPPESPRISQQRTFFNRVNNLLKAGRHFNEIFAIPRARVPIIKCIHRVTGFSIDINISCRSTLENTQFVRELVRSDPRIRELLLLLKLWAKNMQIIRKANMTSYCLINLIVFYLQQPDEQCSTNEQDAILKSVLQLQRNCKPKVIEGINYAFDLQSPDNRPRIPPALSTIKLLSGFFSFYRKFDFNNLIVSPFLGKAIAKMDFTPEKCKLYRDQLAEITQFMDGVPAPTFPVNRSMCVQDSFALTRNVSNSIVPATTQYFKLCLENAFNICLHHRNSSSWQILENLQYETVQLNAVNTAMDGLLKGNLESLDI